MSPIECVVLSTDALRSSVSNDRASEWVSSAALDADGERSRDVVARFALLRLEQLVGEAPEIPERIANITHHFRVARKRLQRDRRPVCELRAALHVAADHPTEDRGRNPLGDVAHELALARGAQRVEQVTDQTGGLGAERLDPSWSEPRRDHTPEVLMVAAFGAEQGAGAFNCRSVRTGAAHHLEDARAERRIEQQRVAAGVRKRAETVRRAHDPRLLTHRSQLAVGVGREVIGGVVEERQLTRRYRHAAAAYRST